MSSVKCNDSPKHKVTLAPEILERISSHNIIRVMKEKRKRKKKKKRNKGEGEGEEEEGSEGEKEKKTRKRKRRSHYKCK